MQSLDSLENKYELPVKARAKAPLINITIIAILGAALDINVFLSDFLFDRLLLHHL